MTNVASLEAANTLVGETAKAKQAMTTDDFMKIMLTELTNQDPLEPMKNQELLNQIASIQELQSSQAMTESFESITNRFDDFMGQLGTFLNREQLSSASKMIGQMVSGISTDGRSAFGKVVAVKLEANNVLLELDTGETIKINDMTRLGGSSTKDIVGSLVMGTTLDGQNFLVGLVDSVKVEGDNVTLHLESGAELPLSQATIITPDTAHFLTGLFVEGPDQVQGFVQGYRIDGPGIEGVTLLLDNQEELPLTKLTNIRSSNA